ANQIQMGHRVPSLVLLSVGNQYCETREASRSRALLELKVCSRTRLIAAVQLLLSCDLSNPSTCNTAYCPPHPPQSRVSAAVFPLLPPTRCDRATMIHSLRQARVSHGQSGES